MARPQRTLSAVPSSYIHAHSVSTRRMLARLGKSDIIETVLGWLADPNAPEPALRQAGEKEEENDRAEDAEELAAIYEEMEETTKLGKHRVVDRVVQVDWPLGLSYGQIAQLDIAYHKSRPGSRTWSVLKLIYPDEKSIPATSAKQLKAAFSANLTHFFQHHLYLVPHPDTPYFRLTILDSYSSSSNNNQQSHVAPAPDLPGPSHIIHLIPLQKTPFVLFAGGIGPSAKGDRDYVLQAWADAAGASGFLLEKGDRPAGAAADESGKKLAVIMKGKDVSSLRELLLGGKSAGKWAKLRKGAREAEENPLLPASKRRRKERQREEALHKELTATSDGRKLSSAELALRTRRHKEASDLLGREELPKLERVEYELSLPYPSHPIYTLPSTYRPTVHLRLAGSHVLRGLRTMIETGLADADADDAQEANGDGDSQRRGGGGGGVPAWLALGPLEEGKAKIKVEWRGDDASGGGEGGGGGGDRGRGRAEVVR